MTLEEIRKNLNADVLSGQIDQNHEIKFAKAADLMSDVLAFADSGSLLITGLTHNQVIRTSEIAGICAIVFVRGKKPTAEMIKMSKESDIPILSTSMTMFEACGILYAQGLKGTVIKKTQI